MSGIIGLSTSILSIVLVFPETYLKWDVMYVYCLSHEENAL